MVGDMNKAKSIGRDRGTGYKGCFFKFVYFLNDITRSIFKLQKCD